MHYYYTPEACMWTQGGNDSHLASRANSLSHTKGIMISRKSIKFLDLMTLFLSSCSPVLLEALVTPGIFASKHEDV